jgi:3-methyl-2-oxobutanoate hydroxymethyltransferase
VISELETCDGQVLVWHDLLGLTQGRVPRFVKQYEDLNAAILAALAAYVADVRGARFPEPLHTYPMVDDEAEIFVSEADAPSDFVKSG